MVAFKGTFAIPNDLFLEPTHDSTLDPLTSCTLAPTPLPISHTPKERIDTILDGQIVSTMDGGVQRFLVCWRGCPNFDDTWISSDDF